MLSTTDHHEPDGQHAERRRRGRRRHAAARGHELPAAVPHAGGAPWGRRHCLRPLNNPLALQIAAWLCSYGAQCLATPAATTLNPCVATRPLPSCLPAPATRGAARGVRGHAGAVGSRPVGAGELVEEGGRMARRLHPLSATPWLPACPCSHVRPPSGLVYCLLALARSRVCAFCPQPPHLTTQMTGNRTNTRPCPISCGSGLCGRAAAAALPAIRGAGRQAATAAEAGRLHQDAGDNA